jgi:RNA polymerase sigma-70 factor, ECF subfamily
MTIAIQSDEELLAQYARQGDREAFEELVHRYERPLYNYLRKYLGDAGLAEDAFQATFLQVHLKCGQFQPDRRLRPWLFQIAANQAIDLMRRNRRHKAVSLDAASGRPGLEKEQPRLNVLASREAGPGQQSERAEDRQRIRLALAKVPTRFRGVLEMVMLQGLSYQQAADALGIPLGSVKSRLHTAGQCLQRALYRTRLSEAG